ncbi:beta-N-acetylglucosaminidase domain-containing protein [Streptomyces echinoruber]|uniref:beta-N-acetylglucosaminidase domain-containing protein n=1 Tax=Streptomyces echinoruber TaxID=68898 RepID=UPI00167E0157|nr:beta-N-acetylglucosaminidase domain-containing protein [Streptomyces echinoruber]
MAFAVVAGALGTAPAAVAAPSPGDASGAFPEQSAAPDVAVWPRPQSLRVTGTPAVVTRHAAVVADAHADPYALDALRALLRRAGAHTVTTLDPGAPVPAGALVVRARTDAQAPDVRDLPSGGYLLTVGAEAVTLTGVGEDGLFHAVQTLRQLVRADGTIAGATVRDWPGTAVRGVAEGFYGTPWTQRQRLAQLDFLGRTKQNRYLYAPGDDLYRQARWREPYPAAQRAAFRELAERARRNHVTLAWAVAPGQSLCFASDADLRALARKLDAMWALGFRAFQLQFPDISYTEWHCGADADRFGSGPEAAARAQARVANALARHLAERHPGAAPLTVLPTEFYEDGATPYRTALAGALDADVEVAWTGVGVVPRTITGRELAGARAAFGGHRLVTADNYPVNDYAADRLFLGPYTGREPAVAAGSAALLATAMQQAEASRIPLFTAADFAWNPRAYRPQESWRAAIADLADGDARRAEALAALAGNDASSVLGGTESAYLRPPIEDLWRARATNDPAANEAAERRLRHAFTVLRELPERLGDDGLGREVAPWAEQLARYGAAGTAALDMLRAQRTGDPGAAWAAYRDLGRLRAELGRGRVTVGQGVLDPFLARAARAYASWAGLEREPAASRGGAGDGRTVRLPRARALEAVTVLTDPGTTGDVEVHVPGEGWHRVGALSATGATNVAARARADAVRVTGPSPSRVHHLVPWYADSAPAALELSRTEADLPAGTTARVATARLTSLRPADAHGRLTVEAPRDIRVHVPRGPLTVPRGTTLDVPVEVTVPHGASARSYTLRLSFAGVTRTVTVRAFPPTGGPDLARTGTARSSGDETPDFPASAAIDGNPSTRWSSPVDDGAWWQVELPRPARLGQVVLHWQDAHPAAYRVQVSPDGRHWRTAVSVRSSRGGREVLRMDERDVRHLRVQGEKRATAYGYSLWSVEAYAVTDRPARH